MLLILTVRIPYALNTVAPLRLNGRDKPFRMHQMKSLNKQQNDKKIDLTPTVA
jgi:hypothetical protein